MPITSNLRKKFSNLKNKIFLKKSIYSPIRKCSYPFISGDTFLSISDCFIIKGKSSPGIISDDKKKQKIFIENDLLSEVWVREYAKDFKIVILHNGDEVPKLKYLEELTDKKIYIFGTNIKFLNQYIKPIPIGIENAHHKKNGNLDYYNPVNMSDRKKEKTNLIFASFSVNTEVRKEYQKVLQKYNIENIFNLSLDVFRTKLNNSYFTISPPGNGLDCHRTWEALYHKSVPVIERKYYLFSHIDLPILVVDKLEEFLNYSNQKKLNIYKCLTDKYNEKIYMQWWINYINSKCL